jgi:mannan endo-1,4-beta-mannosidase
MKTQINKLLIIFLSIIICSCAGQKKDKDLTAILVSDGPCDTLATAETKALYKNLKELAKTKVLFGHQDDLAYGVKWWDEPGRSDVKETSGSYPAVYGWEIGNIAGERNLDSVSFVKMKAWIREGYERGGIITISWHEHNLATGGTAWDTSGRAVSHILPGGSHHQEWKQKLDLVAGFLSDLKGENGELIPVVFRPYHEHTGSWFWWGAGSCTPEEYKQLWHFTEDYLKNEKHVHNLLYAYSPDFVDSEAEYLERYPGNECIDILGFDDYRTVRNQESAGQTNKEIHTVVGIAEKFNKIPAWTETGLASISDPEWWTGTLLNRIKADTTTCKIAWVLVWRNARPDHHYAPFQSHQSGADFKKFREDSCILFEDDLPELYH